jgi:hypothetical protein
MRGFSESRRNVLGNGIYALAGSLMVPLAAAATTARGLSTNSEALVRKYYGGWEKKDWVLVDGLLVADFTFTSAAPDDHISKEAFKKQCWDTQSALIETFDLEQVLATGQEAFVKYLCRTKSGKAFRNVEYLKIRGNQLEAIECYFGGPGYPSAANKDHP